MSKDKNEQPLSDSNKTDVFKCTDCKKTTTRGEIRKKWKHIPFGNEERKTYYCGCYGWD